jgi:hypothetical protein
MSTTRTNTTTNNYNPGSMAAYNSFQSGIQSGLMNYAANPYAMTYGNTQYQMGNRQNQSQQSNANQMDFGRMSGMNSSNPSAYTLSQLNKNAQVGAAGSSNTYNALLMNTNATRMRALQQMQNYRPLQTGQTQTSTLSGPGTWMGPLIQGGMAAVQASQQPQQNDYSGAYNSPQGYTPHEMYDTSGGAFGEGAYNGSPFGNPTASMPNPFLQ